MYYDYLREQSGKHFDPRVLDLFLAVVSEWEAEWAAKQKVFTALG